jgi:hypothetical protein
MTSREILKDVLDLKYWEILEHKDKNKQVKKLVILLNYKLHYLRKVKKYIKLKGKKTCNETKRTMNAHELTELGRTYVDEDDECQEYLQRIHAHFSNGDKQKVGEGIPKYDGERSENGMRHGTGTYTYPNGKYYKGTWKNDKKHGEGKLYFKDGEISYEGFYKDGKRHGKGKMTDKKGNKYNGDWVENKKHGKGVYKSVTGSVSMPKIRVLVPNLAVADSVKITKLS